MRFSQISLRFTLSSLLSGALYAQAPAPPTLPPPSAMSTWTGTPCTTDAECRERFRDGQMLGVDILRSGQETARNRDSAGNSNPNQVDLRRTYPSYGPTRANPTGTIYTREYMPGAASQREIDAIIDAGKDPNGLQAHAIRARRAANEVGCRATSLIAHEPHYLPFFTINIRTTTRTALPAGRSRIDRTGWDNTGSTGPYPLHRDFTIHAIEGSNKITYRTISTPTEGVPDSGRELEISEHPLGTAADGSIIMISARVFEYGPSGWQLIASAPAEPSIGTHQKKFEVKFRINEVRGAIAVLGEFYRVQRVYTPISSAPNGVCPTDPPSCTLITDTNVQANLCTPQNQNVWNFLTAIGQPENQRRIDAQAHNVLTSSLAANRTQIARGDPNAFANSVMAGSRQTLAGNPPQPAPGQGFSFNMNELFPGCAETRTTSAYSNNGIRRVSKYESCTAAIDPNIPRTCNGVRSVGFTKVGTFTVATFERVRNTKTSSCPSGSTYTNIPPLTWNDPNVWNQQARSFTYSSCPVATPYYIGQPSPIHGISPPVTFEYRNPINATTWGPWQSFTDLSQCSADIALRTVPRPDDQSALQIHGNPGRNLCMPGEYQPSGTGSTLSSVPFTGTLPFEFSVFGAPEALNQPIDPAPNQPGTFDFWQIQYNRIALDPSTHFAFDVRVVPRAGTTPAVSVTSLGESGDSWRVRGSAQLNAVNTLDVIADVYMVPVNEITGCDNYIKMVADRYCSVPPPGQITCTDNRGPCTTLNGVAFCDTGATAGVAKLLKPWGTTDSARLDPSTQMPTGLGGGPIELLNNQMCFAATGPALSCNLDAQASWQNNFPSVAALNGYVDDCRIVRRTPDDGSPPPSTPLMTDPTCRLVDAGSRCQGESVGVFSGICYNREVVFDCGRDEPAPPGFLAEPSVAISQSCSGGALRCLGTDCHAPTPEANPNFGMLAAASEIVSAINQHTVCAETGNPPASDLEPCTPTVFGGKKRTCSFPVTSEIGVGQHCCRAGEKAAAGVNMLKWVTMLKLAWKLKESQFVMNAMRSVGGTTGLSAAYESVASSASSLTSATTKWFTDAFQSIAGNFGWSAPTAASALPAATPQVTNVAIEGAAQGLSQFNPFTIIEQKIRDFATDALTQVFSAAGATNAPAAATQAVNFVQNVLFWYSVAQLVGNLIYDCEQEELSTGMERKSGNCHYLGQRTKRRDLGLIAVRERVYCCYASPLARIIMENIRNSPTGSGLDTRANDGSRQLFGQALFGGWGSLEAPRCEGLTPAQLGEVDWGKVDLMEWLETLRLAGLTPNNETEFNKKFSLKSNRTNTMFNPGRLDKDNPSLSGPMAPDVEQPGPHGPLDRVQQTQQMWDRFSGRMITGTQQLATQPVCYSNSKLMPWYEAPPAEPEEVIRLTGGTAAISQCGIGCIEVILGNPTNNNLNDNCTRVFDQTQGFMVERPELIVSATITEGNWDDHTQVTLNGSPVFTSSQWYNSRPLGGTACDLLRSWRLNSSSPSFQNPQIHNPSFENGIDVSSIFKAGGEVIANTKVVVGGGGESYFKLRILYTPVAAPTPGSTTCYHPDGRETTP